MANIQQSWNQILYSSQIGLGFAANTPKMKEKIGAKAAEETKIQPSLSALEQYSKDLDIELNELEASKEYTKKGGERYSKTYLEDRYRKYSAADYNLTRAIQQHPTLSEKYGETQNYIRGELNRIKEKQEQRGYTGRGKTKQKV